MTAQEAFEELTGQVIEDMENHFEDDDEGEAWDREAEDAALKYALLAIEFPDNAALVALAIGMWDGNAGLLRKSLSDAALVAM